MFLFEVIFLVTTIVCIFNITKYYFWIINLRSKVKNYPGPRTVPFLGNAHYFAGNTEDILNKILHLTYTYPSPCRIWLGNRLFIGVYDADQLKTVLLSAKTIEKEDMYKFFRPWLGTGLFTAPASKWRIHRKLIMPTFNSKILESFVEIFAQQSFTMIREMEVEIDAEAFDVSEYISLCTLDIICETAMGVAMNAQTDRNCSYVDAAKRMLEIVYTRVFNIWFHYDVIFNRSRTGEEQRECLKYLHNVTNEVIQKKRNKSDHTNYRVSECSDEKRADGKNRRVFLDLLMELTHKTGTQFSDEELREEVDTMLIAGNDTTATINSFVMLMLANFPEIQEKVFKELFDIYGWSDPMHVPVKCEDLPRMEYLERVIKETMRLFPIGPILVRHVNEDLSIGTYTLPQGSSVVLCPIKVHRSEKYWTDPFKFDPDRFLPENVVSRHPYCYIPFSAGPRNCIGLKYAMLAMKTITATVLRRYKLKVHKTILIKDIKLKVDALLKPAEPIMIQIARRHQQECH